MAWQSSENAGVLHAGSDIGSLSNPIEQLDDCQSLFLAIRIKLELASASAPALGRGYCTGPTRGPVQCPRLSAVPGLLHPTTPYAAPGS